MPHQSLPSRLRKRLKEEGDLRRPTQEQINEMVERRTRDGAITEGKPSKPRPPKRRPPKSRPPKPRPPKRRPLDRAEDLPKPRPPKRRKKSRAEQLLGL